MAQTKPLHLCELEDRVLFSVAPLPLVGDLLAEGHVDAADDSPEAPLLQPPDDALVEQGGPADPLPEDVLEDLAEPLEFDPLQDARDVELIFVDAAAENSQDLVDDLLEGADSFLSFEVILLDAESDGVYQIGQVLAQRDDVAAVHLVSDGDDGDIKLGNAWLSHNTLRSHAETIKSWGHALSGDADVLIYGCDLASNEDGQSLMAALRTLTSAEVEEWRIDASPADGTDGDASIDSDSLVPLATAASVDDDGASSHLAQGNFESNNQADGTAAMETIRRELVLVDAAADVQQLLDDLGSENDPTRDFEVVLLQNDRDGIDQISEILAGYDELDAVHIVSHGADGAVKLGNAWLQAETLDAYAGQIAAWGGALSADADLLLYGCDLAAGDDGQRLVESLAALCNCDVAASTDDTGHAFFGGDWDLEYTSGQVETSQAFSVDVQQSWAHLLNVAVDATSTGTAPTGAVRLTLSHKTSGNERLMLVGISFGEDQGDTVSSVTYRGANLTLLGAQDNSDGAASRVEIWALVAPNRGTHDVVVSFSGTNHEGATVGVMTFNGVDQSTPVGTFAASQGDSASPSTTVDSDADEVVFGVAAFSESNDWDFTPGAGQTEQWDLFDDKANGAGTTESGSASVITSWSLGTTGKWVAGGVSIRSAAQTISFQNGTNGFTGTEDTELNSGSPGTPLGNNPSITIDLNTSGDETDGLIRFDDIFGSGPDQIPVGSTINSASLRIHVTDPSSGGALITLHRMLVNWDEASTWNSLTGGITADGVEANAIGDSTLANPNQTGFVTFTGLASTLQDWSNGSTNFGWAILTDSTNGWDFSTSENATVSQRPELIVSYTSSSNPVVTLPGGPLSYTENDPATAISSAATVTDADSPDFDRGTLTVDFIANGTASDRLGVRNEGAGAGQIGVSGSNVTYEGTTIGTFTGGTDGSTPLVITFNANATPIAAQALTRNITYANVSDDPSTNARTVRVVLTDGEGGISNAATHVIDVAPVNDAPVVTAPGGALSASEQVGLAIEGAGFSVSDVDEAGGGAAATLSVGEGTITVAAGDSGVSIDGGNGTGMVSLSGTIAQLNNLLSGGGTGTITYLNGSDTPSPSTTLTLTVNDQGNTGADPGLSGDGGSEEGSANVAISLTAVNDDPANAGTLPTDVAVTQDVSSDVDLSALDLTDVDAGGGDLTLTLTTATGGNLYAASGGGVTVGGSGTGLLTLRGTLANLNTFLDTPANLQYLHGAAGTAGDDADTIQVDVTDNGHTGTGGGGTILLGAVNVDIGPANSPPVIATTNLNAAENQTMAGVVVATDADLPPDPLTWSLTGAGSDDGLFSIDGGSGALTFQTAPNFEAPGDVDGDNVYEVELQVFDGTVNSTKTITVTVTDINDAPVITSDGGGAVASVSVAEGSTGVTTITATDEDAPADTLTFSIVGGADAAQLGIDSTTGELTFNAARNFEAPSDADADGVYELHVAVGDGNGGVDMQGLSIVVTDGNDVPVANPDGLSTDNNAILIVNAPGLLSNDLDEDGDPLTAVLVVAPSHGLLTLQADGSLTYTPVLSFFGTESFTYVVTDGIATSGSATVTIAVLPTVGPPPPGTSAPSPDDPADADPDAENPDEENPDEEDNVVEVPSITPPNSPSEDSDGHIPTSRRPRSDAPSVTSRQPVDVPSSVVKPVDELLPQARSERATQRTPHFRTADSQAIAEGDEFETATLFAALDSLVDDLANQNYFLQLVVGTSVVATGALSAGFVLWTARAGYLLTLLSSSLPAWAMVDPIPVLDEAALRRKEERDVELLNAESLVDIAQGRRR